MSAGRRSITGQASTAATAEVARIGGGTAVREDTGRLGCPVNTVLTYQLINVFQIPTDLCFT